MLGNAQVIVGEVRNIGRIFEGMAVASPTILSSVEIGNVGMTIRGVFDR